MENPTEFNLEDALRNWCEELSAQHGLTPETRKELEMHLRDTMAELRERGLNAEEAFWLARRRTGPPHKVGEEFAKADPSSAWRSRALQVAAALLAVWIIQGVFSGISGVLGVYELLHLTYSGPIGVAIPQTLRQPHAISGPMESAVRQAPFHGQAIVGPVVPHTLLQDHAMFGPHHWDVQNNAPWWVDGLRNGLQTPEADLVLGACGAIMLIALISRRSGATPARVWRLVFRSKGRFMLIGFLTVVVIFTLERWSEGVSQSIRAVNEPLDYTSPTAGDSLSKLTFPLTLIAFITLLIPSPRGKKISKISRILRLEHFK